MTWLLVSNGKSGKREVAVSLLLFWFLLTCYVFFYIDKEAVTFYRELYGMVTTSIFLFAAGAFGFDAYLKNRGPEPAARMPSSFGRSSRQSPEID